MTEEEYKRKGEGVYYGSDDPEDYKDWVDHLPNEWDLLRLKHDENYKDLVYDES